MKFLEIVEHCKYSRFKNIISKLNIKKLESSALGDNQLIYIECFGRIHLDLFKVV